jgi:CBS domain containing-hemolysin-like protein
VTAPTDIPTGTWQTVDTVLVVAMPMLLLASALFSGSETALFGMSATDRLHFRRSRTLSARAVQSLLADQRMLLITLMLGNMTVNALYFVISSVLLLRRPSPAGEAAIAFGSLLAIVLLGEVLPKMIGNARRVESVSVVAPILLVLHRLIFPLRLFVETVIVDPLSRLTAPADAPPRLSVNELRALLDLSGREGVIDAEEQRILREVFTFSRMRVRHVMTPRVRMHALPVDATRSDVVNAVRETRLTRLPVYEGTLDNIVGTLPVKRYLLADPAERAPLRPWLGPAKFVPQMATLDQLLEEFRRSHAQSAIVVDEFGGTAGIVAIRDVVEEIVGDIVAEDELEIDAPKLIGINRWQISGDFGVHDWAEAFGQRLVSPQVATVGGLIMQSLGRLPTAGDVVRLGNVQLEVEQVDRARIVSAIITLLDEEGSGREAEP